MSVRLWVILPISVILVVDRLTPSGMRLRLGILAEMSMLLTA